MKAFKRIVVLMLCVVFSINCTTISKAEEVAIADTDNCQVLEEDGINSNAVNKSGDSRAYLINQIKKVTVSPAYYNETDKKWYYYSSRMVTEYPTITVHGIEVPFSTSMWSGLSTTHVRVQVTFEHQYSGVVTPYIDGAKSEPLEYSSGTCTYTYYYIPRNYQPSRNLQLYFDRGTYNMLNIDTYVKEWR